MLAALASAQVTGVPNFQKVNDQVYRGGQPSSIGFTNLAALGIRFPGVPTIVGPYGYFDARARVSAPLIDLYELNMVQAYLDRGRTATAVFELFVRKLPDNRNFLLAAGLEQARGYPQRISSLSVELRAAPIEVFT